MTASSEFLNIALQITLVMLCGSFLLTVIKVIQGPSLPDRILALDMLVAVAIGFIAALGIKTGYTLYLDIAIALGLVGFLATIAFARFVLTRGRVEEKKETDMPRLVKAEAEHHADGKRPPADRREIEDGQPATETGGRE